MDLGLETTSSVSVATFLLLLLLPILWIRVHRSKPIQPKYKRGITMGLILLSALVVLCTREYTEYEYYTGTFQLATLLVFVLLFILVVRACWGQRKYELGIVITLAVMTLAFIAFFARESTKSEFCERANKEY